MGRYTYFLFAQPSFLEGAARILDFGDTLTEYNVSVTPQQADYYALLSDWRAVGDAITSAAKELEPKPAKG